MANIENLLNPMPDQKQPSSTPSTPKSSPNMANLRSPRKKAKLTKDAAVFTPGPVKCECRFQPDESQDDELEIYHRQFEVHPFGDIASYPRHIPYNSEKKAFMQKTNRTGLEVFQYTFKVPGDETVYTMLWDYNIGLVRITPLFKCTGYAKTAPRKMIDQNPGLKEICHNITGGSLVAQGYWVPHAAAKALAATFCFNVRHALTPVFGHDFPQLCIKPEEKGYRDMRIDPDITKRCTEQARQFREEAKNAGLSKLTMFSQSPSAPGTPSPQTYVDVTTRKQKTAQQVYSSPYDSPYLSDTGSEDTSTASTVTTPRPLHRNAFTPVDTPRQPPRSVPYPERRLPSPRDILAQANRHYQKLPTALMTPAPTHSGYMSPDISPKTIPHKTFVDGVETTTYTHSPYVESLRTTCNQEWLDRTIPEDHQMAAHALLSLKFNKTAEEVARGLGLSFPGGDVDHKRSASW